MIKVTSLVCSIPNLERRVGLSPYPSKLSIYASIGYASSNEDALTSLYTESEETYFLGMKSTSTP